MTHALPYTSIYFVKGRAVFLKKLFQAEPIIEMMDCRQFRMIGEYQFLEASEKKCKFIYEGFLIMIEAETVHINVLKEEECLIHVEKLIHFDMIRQVNKNETV